MAHSLRIYGNGVSSQMGWLVPNHLAWAIFGLTQGPSWWLTHLSAKMDSSMKDSGRLVGHIVSSLLLLAPPEFSQLVFSGSTMFLIGTSCCEETRASGYPCVWLRWAVLVNVSLTILPRKSQGIEETFRFVKYSILIFSPIDENNPLVCMRPFIFVKVPQLHN